MRARYVRRFRNGATLSQFLRCWIPEPLLSSRCDHQGAPTLHKAGKGYSNSGIAVVLVFTSLSLLGSVALGQTSGAASQPGETSAQNQAPVLAAKFEGTLNTKAAKVGDPVNARTMKDLKLKDLDIPKGSRLVGTVASVESMQAGKGTSSLAIRFDHVELKGAILRVQGLIVAIGPAPELDVGLGYNSVLNRGGAGATPELDPSIASDHYAKGDSDLPKGSTLEGVALALHFDSAGATELRGGHRDIKLDSSVMIKVALFKGA